LQDDPPFDALQFTVNEVRSVLLELDVNKGAGPDGIPPFILRNCASTFAHPLSLLYNKSLSTCVFPDGQVETFLRDTDIQEKQAQQRRGLSEHVVDVMVFAVLGFIRRLSFEFRASEIHTF
jgi:hypothetical protein